MEKNLQSYLDSFPSQDSVKAQPVLSDQRLSDFQLLRNLPGVKFRPSRTGDSILDQTPFEPISDEVIDTDS